MPSTFNIVTVLFIVYNQYLCPQPMPAPDVAYAQLSPQFPSTLVQLDPAVSLRQL
jgi:hypothetical protein